jgi:hypothetical protein
MPLRFPLQGDPYFSVQLFPKKTSPYIRAYTVQNMLQLYAALGTTLHVEYNYFLADLFEVCRKPRNFEVNVFVMKLYFICLC